MATLTGQRIVHVLTSVRHGGAERVVLDLAAYQRGVGAIPSVLCLHQLGDLQPRFTESGVPVELLPGAERPGVLRTSRHLAQWLRRRRPDVIHTHNAAPQIAAGLAKRIWRAPIRRLIHTEHGRLSDVRGSLLRLRRWTAAAFDAVVAVSANAREQLLAAGIAAPAGVTVVHNGVDIERFVPASPHSLQCARIVHVGRLYHVKGQDVLIDAMAAVHALMPGARLTIVGDGPTRAALEGQTDRLGLRAVIRFEGSCDDVRPFLAAADVFVLPSRSEGISIALLEAMATGVPAVATDVGGNAEVIDDSVGLLVPSESPDTLAQAVISILSIPERSPTLGLNARRRVETDFSLGAAASAYSQVYDA
jgi:glycosyltransferase involved in cell wall biosynthesis